MKKLFLTTLLIFTIQAAGQAQSTFGFHLDSFVPTGDLRKDSPELWGAGFSMEAVVQLKNSPIHVGGQIGMLRYGSEVRDGWHGPFLLDARVRRHNELANMLGIIRLKPNVTGKVQPYADFMAGFSYVYTRSVIRDSALEEPFITQNDFNDFSFNYGVGGGIEFFLNDYLSLDLRARALKGSRTDYLTSRSVSYNTESEEYDMRVKESKFSYAMVSLGIKATLWSLN